MDLPPAKGENQDGDPVEAAAHALRLGANLNNLCRFGANYEAETNRNEECFGDFHGERNVT